MMLQLGCMVGVLATFLAERRCVGCGLQDAAGSHHNRAHRDYLWRCSAGGMRVEQCMWECSYSQCLLRSHMPSIHHICVKHLTACLHAQHFLH
jgi:hypothetical protein